MIKSTKKNISEAIEKATGHKVSLFKDFSIYYWHDKDEVSLDDCVCVHFDETCTHISCLTDLTIEQWVNDFKYRLEII